MSPSSKIRPSGRPFIRPACRKKIRQSVRPQNPSGRPILQQHLISCRSCRGEALLSFRRAPRGPALRRYRVRSYHATAVAQSYCGSFGLPAFLAPKGKKDALAVTSLSHSRYQTRPTCKGKPRRAISAHAGLRGRMAATQRKTSRLGSTHARRLSSLKAKPVAHGAPPSPPPRERGGGVGG